jgi:von Willebrand factor type A domain
MKQNSPASFEAKRIFIADEDGYSAFWRRNKSPVEPIELACLLASIRKMVSFVGRNAGDVVWSGMETDHGIALDPAPIMGHYPVPAAGVDLMVGLAIQAAFKRVEWSERLIQLAKQKANVAPQYDYKMELFLRLCEDVYVDNLANASVLGYYAGIARKWRIARNERLLLAPPTLSEVMHIWWASTVNRNCKSSSESYTGRIVGNVLDTQLLDRYYEEPIDLLNSLAEPLRVKCPAISGVAERVAYRAELFASLWKSLLPYICFWPGDRGDRVLVPDTDDRCTEEQEDEEAVKVKIGCYSRIIERALPTRNRDLTAELKSHVDDIDAVVKVAGNDIVMIATDRIDYTLLRKLERVVKAAAQRNSNYNRGLTTGKIHSRRLYRAHTTGTVFQEKRHQFDLRNDMIFLVDATGSMADPEKWNRTEMLFQTLFSAVHRFNKRARLFAYNEVGDACRLSELYRNDTMLTILPKGKTASGEAIIATALATRRANRRRMLIHITDGASNWGCGVGEAVAHCKRHDISLLTIGVGCSASGKQSLRDEYKELVQFMDEPNQLPRLFASLLRLEKRN